MRRALSHNVRETIRIGGDLTNIYGLSLTLKGKCQSPELFSIYKTTAPSPHTN